MYPSQVADQFVVRLPQGMRQRIRQRAAANRRSMNAEIVYHLDRVLMADENETPAAAATAPGLVPAPPCEESK